MTGYQEILTDPSYAGQIVTMTYPLIGNYGVNTEDLESSHAQVAGFVVRELARLHHNYRADMKLEDWLDQQRIVGIQGIDTRALTRKLRIDGAMNGVLSVSVTDDRKLVDLANEVPSMSGRNLARLVSPTRSSDWDESLGPWVPVQGIPPKSEKRFRVVAIDCGAKHNILRNLVDRGCEVVVVPHDISAEEVRKLKPDGLFISNGPGDPDPVTETITTLKELQGDVPTFGICLGHQLLGLSLGASRFKLKFGHRGGNQPVQNLATRKVEITSQNHGFGIDLDSLRAVGAEPTHINLNDGTLEGFRHPRLPIFAVQYHPEASPGPHDASYLFDCFVEMMKSGQSPTAEQMDEAQRRRGTLLAGG
jgi:carbamoyl-phosphate synthase small subunit